MLRVNGIESLSLHGGLNQKQRTEVLAEFRVGGPTTPHVCEADARRKATTTKQRRIGGGKQRELKLTSEYSRNLADIPDILSTTMRDDTREI